MIPPRRRSLVSLATALVAVSLAVPACRPKITAPSEPPLAVRLGDDAFRLQDYEVAIEDYSVYIDSVERGEYTPLAFYQTALCWYRLEQYEQTLDVLTDLDRRYADEHWVQVDALRGDAQYKLGRRSAALIAWDEGWSTARPNERPELRRRIVAVLREMDEAELAETSEIVETPDVVALVQHHLAIAQRHSGGRPSPALEELPVASASLAAKGAPEPAAATARAEAGTLPASKSSAPTAAELTARADVVSTQADEVGRLSDELDETGDDVFEAIKDTEQAEGEIRAVDESTATYAPLLRVEIPEPPFVDQPVPEPNKRIRVAPPETRPVEIESVAASEPPALAEENVDAVKVVSGPPVGLEPVEAQAAAAVAPAEAEVAPSAVRSDVKVACVLPLTGTNRAAGESLLRSIRLVFAEEDAQIIFRDSGSDREEARRLLVDLSADASILLMIAPASAGDAGSIAGSAEQAAVPLLLVSPTTVPKSQYVLPVAAPTGFGADTFAAEYQARYGASPDNLSSKGYSAALLARRALQIAPVPRGELLSRLGALPPPSAAPAVSGSARDSAPKALATGPAAGVILMGRSPLGRSGLPSPRG